MHKVQVQNADFYKINLGPIGDQLQESKFSSVISLPIINLLDKRQVYPRATSKDIMTMKPTITPQLQWQPDFHQLSAKYKE